MNGLCRTGETCIAADGGLIGQCTPNSTGDAGTNDGGNGDGGIAAADTSGIIEGGGCSCSTTVTSATSPFAMLGAAASVLFLVRRRQKRSTERSKASGTLQD